MDIIRACHGPCDWAGPGWAYLKIVTGRAWPGRDFWKMMGPAGPGRQNSKMCGLSRAAAHPLEIWWPIISKFDGPGWAAAHEMWALYGPHRPAHEAAHVFDGPAWIVAREMWCTTAATATSTVPMGPPMCFGPGRGPWDVVYYSYNYDFLGCVWVVIHQKQLRSYYALLANRLGYNKI